MNGQNTRKLTTAGLAITLLTAGVGGYFWQSRATAQTDNAPPAVAQTPAIKDAATMQSAFAQVARTVEPAVVTITTTVKRPQMTRQFRGNTPGDGQSPFSDDDIEEFMRRFGRGRMQPNSASPDQQIGQGNFRLMQETAGGLGSGFIFDKSGLIMTNAHVVRGASTVNVQLADGREFKNAKVLGTDSRSDIAVIKIDGNNLPSVTLGDSGKVQVGDWAIAVGNPFGLSNTLTVGVISAKAREVPMDARTPGDYLQTDASINPGNSGGPLLDIYGRVVGVNNSIWSPTGSNVGVGFAIPINTAKDTADQLIKDGRVHRAQLGVGIGEVGSNASAFGLPAGTQGVMVTMVEPNGPAAKAGLQTGDVITQFNGEAVVRPSEIQRRVAAAPIGQDATLTIIRGGETKTLKVRLDEAADDSANPRTSPRPNVKPQGESIDQGQGRQGIGISVAPMTPDLAEQLNVKPDTKGIVIADVQQGSPAENAGLQPGDIITRVGQATVATPEDVRNNVKKILDSQTGDDKKVALYITRRGASTYVVVSQ